MVSPQPRGVPGPSPGRSAACDAMFAAGRRRLGHLHGLKAKRLRLSVLFLAGSARQRSSVPPAGRAGRQAREDRAGRAGGQTGHRRREVTAGELQPAGLQSAAAPASAAAREGGETGKGRQRPPASPCCGRGSPRAGGSVPGCSPAAAAARRGGADGQSRVGAGSASC